MCADCARERVEAEERTRVAEAATRAGDLEDGLNTGSLHEVLRLLAEQGREATLSTATRAWTRLANSGAAAPTHDLVTVTGESTRGWLGRRFYGPPSQNSEIGMWSEVARTSAWHAQAVAPRDTGGLDVAVFEDLDLWLDASGATYLSFSPSETYLTMSGQPPYEKMLLLPRDAPFVQQEGRAVGAREATVDHRRYRRKPGDSHKAEFVRAVVSILRSAAAVAAS
jgi:hypothetical protein